MKGYLERQMIKLKRLPYYLQTIWILLGEIRWSYPLLLKRKNLRFKISGSEDLLAIKEVILDDDYRSGKVQVEERDKFIVDIGGGIGDFSIMAANRIKGRVLVFEPNITK